MAQWTGKDVLDCLNYGLLFVVKKWDDKFIYCQRVRKQKNKLFATPATAKIVNQTTMQLECGDLIFIDNERKYQGATLIKSTIFKDKDKLKNKKEIIL